MDFKNASELLALCTQQQLPISEIMRRRECQLGETTRDEVTHRMKRALEIMRSSALTPLKTPVKSMGGLIGGEAKKLAQHAAKGRSICGDVLHKAAQYAMAVLEVNASMGLIVAAPTAGSAGVLPGMLFALQDRYNISDERLTPCSTPVRSATSPCATQPLQARSAAVRLRSASLPQWRPAQLSSSWAASLNSALTRPPPC